MHDPHSDATGAGKEMPGAPLSKAEQDMLGAPLSKAEQDMLDRPWRVYASIFVGTFTLVSILVGFIVLPLSEGGGLDPFGAICRAIGIPGYERAAAADRPAAAAAAATAGITASTVAWTSATDAAIAAADAARGAKTAAEVCSACHGEAGIGVDPSFPNLAHQSAAALYKQLQDYASGSRTGGQAEIMAPIAAALRPTDMADVAAYYATRDGAARTTAVTAVPTAIDRLARLGDVGRGMAACDSCHGLTHSGPAGSPVLLGQSVPYLEQQLQLFASGERANDHFARMRSSASLLTENERRHLAVYYGGMPIPRYAD